MHTVFNPQTSESATNMSTKSCQQ